MVKFISFFCFSVWIFLTKALFCIEPDIFIENDQNTWTLINSVSFHPKKNIFCVTFTQQHRLGLYQIGEKGDTIPIQMIQNPTANLEAPQHAIFSADGNDIIALNWISCSFNIYSLSESGLYQESPRAVIYSDLCANGYRPHGMALASSGDFLAVAYGFCRNAPSMIALYQMYDLHTDHPTFLLIDCIEDEYVTQGVPKGIAFSKNNQALIVTFSETDSLAVFSIENGKINKKPSQVLQGKHTKLSRPEDVSFCFDGTYCAVSNSSEDNVSFYRFDGKKNIFTSEIPFYVLTTKNRPLTFPHGLAFSPNGKYFVVTQFGSVVADPDVGVFPGKGKKKEGIFVFNQKRFKGFSKAYLVKR